MEYTFQELERREVINHIDEYTITLEDGEVITIPASDERTVFTLIEYDFNGVKISVDIPHFMPQSEDDIQAGIANRAVTEQRKLES